MNKEPCRILHVDDSPEDGDLVRFSLHHAAFAPAISRVDCEADYLAQLATRPDVILCDYDMPRFTAERALEILRERRLDIPFIVVSHHIDGNTAVVTMQQGASDYLPKRDLGRLPKAIEGALERCGARAAKARSEEALHRANQRLQALSTRVLAVQEEERRALSRDLHDDVCQTLAAVKIGLHRLARRAPVDAGELVFESLGMVEEALEKLRNIAHELRPPQLDQLGLEDTLRWLAGRHHAATGVAVACEFPGLENRRPPAVIESTCYRIAQEALGNAARHANARHLFIAVRSDGPLLELSIRDDGVGFEEGPTRLRALKAGSLGLISMEERAQLAGGRLVLRSAPGSGTTVSATFPLEPQAAQSLVNESLPGLSA